MPCGCSMVDYEIKMKQYFKLNSRTKDYSAHSAKVHSVAWNCDGRKLASGSFDQTATVFLLDKDRLVWFSGMFQHVCMFNGLIMMKFDTSSCFILKILTLIMGTHLVPIFFMMKLNVPWYRRFKGYITFLITLSIVPVYKYKMQKFIQNVNCCS